MSIRAFIAITVGEDVRSKLVRVQSILKEANAHVSWVPAENIHLSLAFLGDITQDRVADVTGKLDLSVNTSAPFSITVETVGSFGSRRSPRIIWAGVMHNDHLMVLQSQVATQVRAAGIELEERPWAPHITLGRVRSARGRDALLQAIDRVAAEPFGQVDVSEVLLIKSVLLSSGAEYSILHRKRLEKQ